MKIYEKTSLINCSIEELFAFHRDLHNLQAITPKDIEITFLGKMSIPQEGDILRIRTVKNFLTIDWKVLIQKVQEPSMIVDLAVKSPFSFWEHSHIFTQKENGMSELKDIVRFKAPLGFIGSIFNFFILYELKKMFSYRHKVTKNMLEMSKKVTEDT